MTTFAKNIKALRVKRGLTQFKLALICDISPQMISQYETGKTSPNSGTLRKLSEGLNVKIDSLIN